MIVNGPYSNDSVLSKSTHSCLKSHSISRLIFSAAFFLVVFANFIPRFDVAGIGLGIEDFVLLLLAPVLVKFILLRATGKNFFLLMYLFVVTAVIWSVIIGVTELNSFKAPTELWQYVKRALALALGFYIGLKPGFARGNLVKMLLIAFLLYFLIGLLQVVGGRVGDALVEFYARSQLQAQMGLYDINKRVFSVSGFSNSWGIFTFFICTFFLAFISLRSRAKLIGMVCMLGVFFLFLINMLYSGSRGGWIASLIGIFVGYGYFLVNRPKRAIGLFPFLLLLLAIGLYFVFSTDQGQFLLYRFSVLGESGGGGRTEQIAIGIGLLDSWVYWLFGVTNAGQRVQGMSYGIESEPFNILVNYGVVGVLLIYGAVLSLTFSILRSDLDFKLKVAYVSSMSAYLAFSLGYFFFAEIVVGVLPWLVFGVLLGIGDKKSSGYPTYL